MEKSRVRLVKNSKTQFGHGVKGDRTLKRAEVKLIIERLKINNEQKKLFNNEQNFFSSEAIYNDYASSLSSKFHKLIQFINPLKTTETKSVNLIN
jgi:hypothetical protein